MIFGLFLFYVYLASISLTRSHLSFEYDGGSNRWKNVRPPATGSVVTATGTFQDIARDGRGEPVLNLLDISYGATEAIAASPTRTIGHRKARK